MYVVLHNVFCEEAVEDKKRKLKLIFVKERLESKKENEEINKGKE